MRTIEIEQWVLRVAEQVACGEHSEDAQVELKAEWPAPEVAARRIAGHANAARGANILWIIGIDEEKGVCGAPPCELAEWMPSVRKYFDEVAPAMTDVNVPVDGKVVVAMVFETDRAPYAVKNPKFGQRDAGPVQWEIPWREGRLTRTARRHDLLRLLAPLMAMPEIECLEFAVAVSETWTDGAQQVHRWDARGSIYVAPITGTTVSFPTHRSSLSAGAAGSQQKDSLQKFHFYVHDVSEANPVSANHG